MHLSAEFGADRTKTKLGPHAKNLPNTDIYYYFQIHDLCSTFQDLFHNFTSGELIALKIHTKMRLVIMHRCAEFSADRQRRFGVIDKSLRCDVTSGRAKSRQIFLFHHVDHNATNNG